MLVIAPIILGASVLVGYWVAGRNLQPLGVMVRELEAITDGPACTAALPWSAPGTRSPGLGRR